MNSESEADAGGATVMVPAKPEAKKKRRRQPRYHVILWDSDKHTFDYVEVMLRDLFGHEKQKCKLLAKEVDEQGKAIVLTTTREHAELKRDQIHAYGPDDLKGSKGAMWSTIEPER